MQTPQTVRRGGRRYRQNLLVIALFLLTGCAQPGRRVTAPPPVSDATRWAVVVGTPEPSRTTAQTDIPRVPSTVTTAEYPVEAQISGSRIAKGLGSSIRLVAQAEPAPEPAPFPDKSAADLAALVEQAATRNARLSKLQQEAAAAWDRARYADALPDPMLGANGFGHPIETMAGSQQANMTLSQRIPWLKRLNAQAQQACYEAWALDAMYQAERLKVIADAKAGWARLYLLGQRKRINESNQVVLKALVDAANERIRAGGASAGDVLLGTLELSRLAEELVTINQQIESTQAMLNQLLDRPAETAVPLPRSLVTAKPVWPLDALRTRALSQQPEISSAQLRSYASRWGIDVARLQRVPDVTFNFNYYFIENNRPPLRIVDVGQDAWSLGAMVNVPLWRGKYDDMESEAVRKHYAAAEGVADVSRRYDALLADALAQARAAAETAELYNATILPQARQTLEADQLSYGQGQVEFDRVIADLRNVITLDAGYHRAIAELFTSEAQLEQAVGGGLEAVPATRPPPAPGAAIDNP